MQHPAGVMVWACCGYGVKGPLIFIPQGLKINRVVYREKVLVPLLEVRKTVPGRDSSRRYMTGLIN